MTVDAATYLLNYAAERMKHKLEYVANSDKNNRIHFDRRELQRLLFELIPPTISATTLLVVTILTMIQSIKIILSHDSTKRQSPPDIVIMLIFSALNLVLDGLNLMEFSKVDHVVLSVTNVHHEHHHHYHRTHQINTPGVEATRPTETSELLDPCDDYNNNTTTGGEDDVLSTCSSETDLNLNMCSAWTHIAADTLRSIAVLIAAGFSFIFPELLTPVDADSIGAILVSIIILVSLLPLIQGIFNTTLEVSRLVRGR